jgi:hypothetical protein
LRNEAAVKVQQKSAPLGQHVSGSMIDGESALFGADNTLMFQRSAVSFEFLTM